MEKLQTLQLIKSIKGVIDTYISTRRVEHVDRDTRLVLKNIWQQGLRFSLLNIACPSCVKAALDTIISFYEREKKHYPELNEPEIKEVKAEEIKEQLKQITEESEVKPKKRASRKNNTK